MDFDQEEKVDEGELDALGIKKKDDAEVDDVLADETVDLVDGEEAEKEEVDGGVFGDDKELEEYMLNGYEDTY